MRIDELRKGDVITGAMPGEKASPGHRIISGIVHRLGGGGGPSRFRTYTGKNKDAGGEVWELPPYYRVEAHRPKAQPSDVDRAIAGAEKALAER